MFRFLSFVFLILILKTQAFAMPVDSIRYGSFGKVVVYKPKKAPTSLVIFVSGDGGWNKGVIDMAKGLVKQGALVAGIDIRHYLKTLGNSTKKCYYPAGDFESLSLKLQKKYKMAQYVKPILVGYSSGATLIYGILAQAPGNTFKGAIALGFCPDLEINKPLCNGSGLSVHHMADGKSYYFEISKKLSAPFIVLLGTKDQVCPLDEVRKYMNELPMGELIVLPKVGHGFSIIRRWQPQYIVAYNKILNAPSYAEQKASQNKLLQEEHLEPLPGNMPITLIPTAKKDTLPMAFIISGDGGWTSFDQSFGDALAEIGIPVVGLDAQKYFWDEKKPDKTTSDVSKAIEHYMKQWNKKTFLLIGYSFGASIAPFIASRISLPLRESLLKIYALSPDEKADFEIHISDMLSVDNPGDNYDVLAEIKKLRAQKPVCIFGEEEEMLLRNRFIITGARVLTLPGNHHYNNDFNALAEMINNGIYK